MIERAARVDVVGRDNIIVQAVGSGIDVAVNIGRPHLRLTQFTARTERVRGDNSDAALLSPYRADVVPLLGRDGARAELSRWMENNRRILVRTLTGAAGRGKTRLALELAREATDKGWLAGFVEHRELDRFCKLQNVAEWAYAPIATGPPLRMLLLERQAHREIGWFASVFGHRQDDRSRAALSLLDPPEPVELPAIDDLASRRKIFATLLERKREDLTAPELGADPELDRLLQHEKWSGDPLFLMMAGLVAASDGVKNALALTRTDMAIAIARRELDRIGRIAADAGVDANNRHSGFVARHMAVLATLGQGLSLSDARQVIREEVPALGSSVDINAAVEALRDALPRIGSGRGVAPISPDIVGEAAVMSWLGNGGALENLGIEALPSINRVASRALRRVTQVLVRTAQDFAAAGRDEPIRWLDALAQAAETDLGALLEIAAELPNQTTALRELAVVLAQRIVVGLRKIVAATTEETGEAHALLSASLANLGARLHDLRRHEEALAASREAVRINRRLAKTRPDAFLPDLAVSLGILARELHDLGRHEEALAAYREAVDINRGLA